MYIYMSIYIYMYIYMYIYSYIYIYIYMYTASSWAMVRPPRRILVKILLLSSPSTRCLRWVRNRCLSYSRP